MADKTPDVDLQAAFYARVIGVVLEYEKFKRKRQMTHGIFWIAGAVIGYAYGLLTL